MQRKLSPETQTKIRLGSIVLGTLLQFGVLGMSLRQSDEIKDKKGPEGDSVADYLEEVLNWIIDGVIDEDVQVADLNDRPPLGDRA